MYRFERGQYQEQFKKLQGTDKQVSSIYGGEHLLRLFGAPSPPLPSRRKLFADTHKYAVNLPELLAHTSLDPESMSVLKDNIQQFLQCVVSSRPCERVTLTACAVQVDGPEPKSALCSRVHWDKLGVPEQQPWLNRAPPLLSDLFVSRLL